MALIDCYEQAIEKVPKWIYKQLKDAVVESLSDIEIDITEIYNEDDGVSIIPSMPYYAEAEEVGLYFGINSIESIVQTDEDDDGDYPHIFLYIDMPKKLEGKILKDWNEFRGSIKNRISQKTNELRENKYLNSYPNSKDINYLMSYNIKQFMNHTEIIDDYEGAILNTAIECKKLINFVIANDLLKPIPLKKK